MADHDRLATRCPTLVLALLLTACGGGGGGGGSSTPVEYLAITSGNARDVAGTVIQTVASSIDLADAGGGGIQGHWSTAGIPYAALDKVISDYASLGLKVSVTELDMTIRGASGGQFGPGFGGRRFGSIAPPAPQDLQAQADACARLFAIFIKHKDAVERVTLWGLSDRRTWRFGQHPLIFDSNNQRKPAYAAIVGAVRQPSADQARPR